MAETVVCCWGIRAPQCPTNGALGGAEPSVRPGCVEELMVGDINTPFDQPQYQRKESLATVIANYMLVDHKLHFVPRQWYRGEGGWSSSIWRYGRPITGRGGYILYMYCRYFYNFCISDTRVLRDHRMILAKLKGYREWRNCKYCKGKKYRTTAVPKRVPMQEEYVIFKDLRKEVKKPMPPARERVTWFQRQPGGWRT